MYRSARPWAFKKCVILFLSSFLDEQNYIYNDGVNIGETLNVPNQTLNIKSTFILQ